MCDRTYSKTSAAERGKLDTKNIDDVYIKLIQLQASFQQQDTGGKVTETFHVENKMSLRRRRIHVK